MYKEAPYQANYLLDDGTYWALDVSRFKEGNTENKTMARTTRFGTADVWTEDVYNIKPSGKWEYIDGSLNGSQNTVFRKEEARNFYGRASREGRLYLLRLDGRREHLRER